MPNVKLLLEYDGTHYHGWQRQPTVMTIQQVLEDTIHMMTRDREKVIGAGRTDAGVHARGQVANFHTAMHLSPSAWTKALNSLLPLDIAVREAEIVPADFHARFSAKGKIYQYRILTRETRSALTRHFFWHIPERLDPARMEQAARYLVGTHDFSSFRGGGSVQKDTICHLTRVDITHEKEIIAITMEADGFLQHMARNIVGTLVEVGKKKKEPEALTGILQARDRRKAGPTAPPHGLILLEVIY